MRVERLHAPDGGFTETASPLSVPRNKSLELKNFLVHRAGKVFCRGSFGTPYEIFTPPNTNHGEGIATVGDKFMFFDITNTARYWDYAVPGVVTPVALANASFAMDGPSSELNNYAYAPAAFAGTVLLRWGGTAVSPVKCTSGPVDSVATCTHLGRLFVAGGCKPGTVAPVLSNRLFWSIPNGPTALALSDWQDSVSGLVNELVVGEDGDAITALASLPNMLVVFKSSSIWCVMGSSPSTFTVRRLEVGIGCLNSWGVRNVGEQVMFISEQGPVLFDGVTITRFPGLYAWQDGTPTSAYRYTVSVLQDNYLMVSMFYKRLYLLHLPTGAWSEVTLSTGAANTNTEWTVLNSSTGHPFFFDGRGVRSCEFLTFPRQNVDYGLDPKYGGAPPVNIIPSLVTGATLLATPDSRASVKHIYVDACLYTLNPQTGSAWSLSASSYDATVLAATAIAGGGSPPGTTFPMRQRTVVDVFAEATDLQVSLTYNPTGAPLLHALEVYDFWVEYDPAQHR